MFTLITVILGVCIWIKQKFSLRLNGPYIRNGSYIRIYRIIYWDLLHTQFNKVWCSLLSYFSDAILNLENLKDLFIYLINQF